MNDVGPAGGETSAAPTPTGSERLARALAAEHPLVADLYEAHMENNGEFLSHVFFSELATEVMNAHLGVPDPDEDYDKELDLTTFFESMERHYDLEDSEAQKPVVTSFILELPWPHQPGYDIRDRLGPVMRAEFDRVRPQG